MRRSCVHEAIAGNWVIGFVIGATSLGIGSHLVIWFLYALRPSPASIGAFVVPAILFFLIVASLRFQICRRHRSGQKS